jgi:hypothetical protein
MRLSNLSIGLIALFAAASVVAQEPERLRYFKLTQSLRRDSTAFAFTFKRPYARSFERAREVLSTLGVSTARVRRVGTTPWFVAPYPKDLVGLARKDAFLRRLSRDPAFSFVSPQWRDAHDGAVVVGPPLYLGVDPRRGADLGATIAEEFAGVVRARDACGVPGVVELDPPTRYGADLLKLADRLASRDDVRFAEPTILAYGRPAHVPSDPEFGRAWALQPDGDAASKVALGAPEAWRESTGDPEIPILVLDDGVEDDHPDLRVAASFDALRRRVGRGRPAGPYDRHGTAVAGVLSADMDNGVGACGLAPGCALLSAKVYSGDARRGYVSEPQAVARALFWGRSLGARVSNLSVQFGVRSAFAAAAYERAYELGMVHFAAAGNLRTEASTFPIDLPFVRSVSALDSDGRLSRFSNYGSRVDFAAPGENILTADLQGVAGFSQGSFAFVSGTSFATPLCAGTAALVVSVDRSLSAAMIEDLLRRTATDLGDRGRDPLYGYGAPHAGRAVAEARRTESARPPEARLVSVAISGLQAAGACDDPSLSGDGAWVAFTSEAGDLLPSSAGCGPDVYAAPVDAGRLVRASVGDDGRARPGASKNARLSRDGRFVAFESYAALDARDDNGVRDVYVRDRDADDDGVYDHPTRGATATRLVSATPNGRPGDGPSFAPALAADGGLVVFASRARNLLGADSPGGAAAYVARRRKDGAFVVDARLAAPLDGEPARFVLSEDGRAIVAEYRFPNADAPSRIVRFDASEDGAFRDVGRFVDVAPDLSRSKGSAARPDVSADGRVCLFATDVPDLDGVRRPPGVVRLARSRDGRVDYVVDPTAGGPVAAPEPSLDEGGRLDSKAGTLVYVGFDRARSQRTVARATLDDRGGVEEAFAGRVVGSTRRARLSISDDGSVLAWSADDGPSDPRDVNRRRDVFVFRPEVLDDDR